MAAAATHPQRRQRGGGESGARGRSRLAWYIAGGVAISAVFVVPLLWEVLRSLQPESAVTQTRRRRAPSAT